MSKPRNTPNAPRRGRNTFVASALVVSSLAAGSIVACSSDAHNPVAPESSAKAPAAASAPTTTGTTGFATNLPADTSQDQQGDANWQYSQTQFNSMWTGGTFSTQPSYTQPGTRYSQPLRCGGLGVVSSAGSKVFTTSSTTQSMTFGRVKLEVPAGAITQPMTIKGTATLSANGVMVDFQPHNTKFAKALRITVDYSGCSPQYSTPLNVYYVNDLGGILQTMPASDSRSTGSIQALTDHFSGFMISWA